MHTALIAAAVAAGVAAGGTALPKDAASTQDVRSNILCSQTARTSYPTNLPSAPNCADQHIPLSRFLQNAGQP